MFPLELLIGKCYICSRIIDLQLFCMKFIITTLCILIVTFVLFSYEKEQFVNKPFPEDKLYVIKQFESQPFLGETYVNDYDYVKGNKFLVEQYSHKSENSGACSSFRIGDFAARNLDWFIRDYAMLVVHTAANAEKNRYASVAIVSSNPYVNRAMIKGGIVNDHVEGEGVVLDGWRNILPLFTTDGINEKGLCVNTNIVVHEEGVRENYVPCTGDKSAEKTSFVSLPRYILDNCASCDEAIQKCSQLNVTQAFSGPLATEDSHFMVSDNQKTVILEWYNNKMVYLEFPRTNNFRTVNGMPSIMTNFYNYIGNKHVDATGKINLGTMLPEHPYAMGVERYETLRDGLDNVCSIESAENQIEKVFYSHYYDMSYKWYTENGMSCGLHGGVWYYPTASGSFAPASSINEAVHKIYESGGYQESLCTEYVNLDEQMRRLDKGIEADNWWYTEFTDVFDIKNKTLYVMPQEGWYKHEYIKFTVDGDSKQPSN